MPSYSNEMKVCKEWFPKGSYKGQKGDGFPISTLLKQQLDILAKNVTKDWDFTIIISGRGEVRVGKTQPLGSSTLMADGSWKSVENIKIGDEIVSPNVLNGTSTISKVTGTHSRFCDNVYNVIKRSTGEKLYACSDNHDIPIEHTQRVKKNGITTYKRIKCNMEAKDIYSQSKAWFRNNGVVTYQGAYVENFGSTNAIIEPYSLGVFIGDGYLNNKTAKHLSITCSSKEVMKEVNKHYKIMSTYKKQNCDSCLSYNFSSKSNFFTHLKKYYPEKSNSKIKFIPRECLTSDANYRLKLLAGLIDTDGYIDKRGIVTYTTASKTLAQNIQELCRSLGGNPNIKTIKKQIKSINFEGTYYTVSINLGQRQMLIPLKKIFKVNRLKIQAQEKNKISIILERSKPQMVYGFELDSESKLYITDNYSVTHNSVLGMQIGIYWTYLMWKIHGKNVPFDVKQNYVFDGFNLIKKGNMLGNRFPYSCLVFDEAGSDLEGRKVMKTTTQNVIDYFRECGQYNMLNILILPEFFDLPPGIAMSRSIFLIDVYYNIDDNDMFERGFYKFYGRRKKKFLYMAGKKDRNYAAGRANFMGHFQNIHTIDETEYRAEKVLALRSREHNARTKFQIQRDGLMYILNQIVEKEKWSTTRIGKVLEEVTQIYISTEAVRTSINHNRSEEELKKTERK